MLILTDIIGVFFGVLKVSLQNILNKLDKVKRVNSTQYKALCPVHNEKTPSLSIKEASNGDVVAYCFGCGANGIEVVSALGLEQSELFRESYKMSEEKTDYEVEMKRQFLDDVAKQSKPLQGDDVVTKYLNNRKITAIPKTVRLLPEYKQGDAFYPCMIARIDDNQSNRISYHLTHLTHDGKKADVEIVKKVLPCERQMAGYASIKLFKHSGTLAVTEGIETALVYHQNTEIPTWALINAQNMKQWECPKDVVNLIIVADMDSSFTGQSVAYELARRSKSLIGKDGYLLERVNVSLIFKNETVIDSGVKCDYAELV